MDDEGIAYNLGKPSNYGGWASFSYFLHKISTPCMIIIILLLKLATIAPFRGAFR